MNFIVDAQLPPGLALWISSHGHKATHVFDIGLQTAVIISKDEDFVDRWLLDEIPVALIWIR